MSRDDVQTLEKPDMETDKTTDAAADTSTDEVTESVDTTAESTESAPPIFVSSDTVDDPTPEPAVRGRSWWPALSAVLVVAVLGLAGALGYTLYQQSELHRLQNQAIATTGEYLTAMASFDYQQLDANKDTILAASTPEFAQKYDEMLGALREIVVTSKGVATATAEHVAVEKLDGDSATVVGFVDQEVTNVTAPDGNKQRYRMVVSLIRDGDRWVVHNVETV